MCSHHLSWFPSAPKVELYLIPATILFNSATSETFSTRASPQILGYLEHIRFNLSSFCSRFGELFTRSKSIGVHLQDNEIFENRNFIRETDGRMLVSHVAAQLLPIARPRISGPRVIWMQRPAPWTSPQNLRMLRSRHLVTTGTSRSHWASNHDLFHDC
jgi:hypothetical protein